MFVCSPIDAVTFAQQFRATQRNCILTHTHATLHIHNLNILTLHVYVYVSCNNFLQFCSLAFFPRAHSNRQALHVRTTLTASRKHIAKDKWCVRAWPSIRLNLKINGHVKVIHQTVKSQVFCFYIKLLKLVIFFILFLFLQTSHPHHMCEVGMFKFIYTYVYL